MRDQQTAIERNLGPASDGEQSIMKWAAFGSGSRHGLYELEGFG